MQDLIKQRLKVGDKVIFLLHKGDDVEGTVSEIGENYIVLCDDCIESTLSCTLISGWRKVIVTSTESNGNASPLISAPALQEIQISPQSGNEVPSKRLVKVCVEFNVPLYKVVEFLRDAGEKIDGNPNSRITEAQYKLISQEFSGNKLEREEVIKANGESVTEKIEILLPDTEVHDTIESEQDSEEDVVHPVKLELYAEIPWKESGLPDEHMFKGREELIERLKRHYVSTTRNKSYILYGLTRSGKSSVLKYLAKELENQRLFIEDKSYTFIPFIWQFEEAASQDNASDMWNFLLKTSTLDKIKKLIIEKKIPEELLPPISSSGDLRFKHLREIIQHLKKYNYYPIFFIDEFTYFKTLHDSGQLTSAFLSTIRGYAFGNLASFVFAGTYDLKSLIRSPAYGITGQLVNTIDEKIERITSQYAKQLINVWNDRLQFSDMAVTNILRLSGSIPYFIQLICKSCGFYALERDKKVLNEDDVEKVAKIITGEVKVPLNSHMEALSLGTFNSNMYDPQDPREVHALVSTLCHLNNGKLVPRGIKIDEILRLWGEKKIPKLNIRVSESIETLKERGIIWENKKSEFKLSSDLFRRWWFNQHPNLELELNFLIDN